MDTQTLRAFADNYTSPDFDRIRFDWNGKDGNEFHDNNDDFRTQLSEFLIPVIGTVKLELIRDLYLEFGKSSDATFGVYMNFNVLAQELLQRGGTPYLLDYLRGAAHTMDTAGRSSQISLTKERAIELLEYFDERKHSTTDAGERKLLNDYFRQRFVRYANK